MRCCMHGVGGWVGKERTGGWVGGWDVYLRQAIGPGAGKHLGHTEDMVRVHTHTDVVGLGVWGEREGGWLDGAVTAWVEGRRHRRALE